MKTIRELAIENGLSPKTAYNRIQKGWKIEEAVKHHRHHSIGNNENGARAKLNELGFELIQYNGTDGKVIAKCNECGKTFEYCSYHNLININKNKRFCPECFKEQKEQIAIQRLCKEQEKHLKNQQQQAESLFNHLVTRLKHNNVMKCECANCGNVFFGFARRRFCSDKCSRRYKDRQKTRAKDKRIKSRPHDKGITLDKVYKRANGICYICGCKCDYDDYQMQGTTFIAGEKYPSIEHIIPIAKGGQDTWLNVALACRHCNSCKSDQTPVQLSLPIA